MPKVHILHSRLKLSMRCRFTPYLITLRLSVSNSSHLEFYRHAPGGLAQRSPPVLVSTSPSAVAASRQRRAPDNATREKAYEKPVSLSEAHRVLLSAQRWQAGVCGCLVRGQQVAAAGGMFCVHGLLHIV